MARAITRDGRTTVYGPGDFLAGTFQAAIPLDETPESAAEARQTDDATLAHWLRTLEQHEDALAALIGAGELDRVERLRAAIERTAGVRELLDTIDGQIDRILTEGGVVPSERHRAFLRTLISGGRHERTWRAWRSGKQLIPEDAADYLGRIREIVLRATREPEGRAHRLRIELLVDE